MWETFISWYINAYLGNYLENLNSQQLSFALRQGELELENVPLKKNIFRSWGLPIEIQSSVVGRIKIEFNLMKYFRNEPVLISIEDIYLVAGPINLENWNPLDEEALVIEAKMNSLDTHEGRWKAQFDLAENSSSYYSSLYFSSIRIGASIVTKVVENLQLNIRNIHIRFEDEIDSRVIAFGITLESLNAESTDSKWNPLSTSTSLATTNSSSGDCSFKTLQLVNFGIYCDTNTTRFNSVTSGDLKKTMQEACIDHTYLVCPVSAEARITKNNSTHPLKSSLQPRFNVHLILERVPLQLSDSQYRNILRAYKSFHRLRRNCRLRHYRPFEIVKGNVKSWWTYAVRAILTIRGYKQRTTLRTWEDILDRGRDNVAYVKIYQKHLLGELLPIDLAKIKERIEVEQHYEEIVALREIAMNNVELIHREKQIQTSSPVPVSSEGEKQGNPSSSTSGGMFSYLFPSWSNWVSTAPSSVPIPPKPDSLYGDTIDAEGDTINDKEEESMSLRKSETEFDEAILDDAKSFGSDALLAKFNFTMRRSIITLKRKTGPFMELDVGGIDILTELKPRSGSHKFKMSVAAMFLRECSTKSILISPHPFSTMTNPLRTQLSRHESTINRDPIFSLSYERKPNKKVGHRVVMTTRPLDLVLFPKVWDDLNLYFTIYDQRDELETNNRYEMMKQRTREELRLYWERLISLKASAKEGGLHSNSWEILLDISAPQIVMHGSLQHEKDNKKTISASGPKTLSEDDGRFLVIDLGRFRFTNHDVKKDTDVVFDDPPNANIDVTSGDDEEDEEFLTPCSSPIPEAAPGSFADDNSISSPGVSGRERKSSIDHELNLSNSLEDLQAKLYKKYRLEITDVQVLVVDGRATSSTKDNSSGSWRSAVAKGASSVHLIDRFSINLLLERRLIYSDDPQWPALTLVGTLPKLNLHLNENKILTMQLILNSFIQSSKKSIEQEQARLSSFSGSQLNLNKSTTLEDLNSTISGVETGNVAEKLKSTRTNAKHFVAQFTIQHITTEIQSRGRSIAELQIIGARTTYSKLTLDTSVTFMIRSLLLVDAVQTFGPDFELLLASHKHVSMDSVSGSLRDSEPTSPMSPQTPASPIPFGHPKIGIGGGGGPNQLAVPSQLHDALLTTLEGKRLKSSGLSFISGFQSPPHEDEALITAKLVLFQNGEDVVDLQVKFNNLDVIANQETLVEILHFIQRVSPASTSTNDYPVQTSGKDAMLYTSKNFNIQATFEFNRLSLLLLRGVVGKDGTHSARKIATATACDAKVNFSLGVENILVEGSLGGLQMLNLTAEGHYHPRIVSVGKDPLVDSIYDILKTGKTTHLSKAELFNETALTFSFHKQSSSDSSNGAPAFKLRMASVIYTHCPVFLIDLKKCIDQFQAPLATKLKSAAAQIALGLVRQDTQGSGGYNSPSRSLSISLDNLDLMEEFVGLNKNSESFNMEGVSNSGGGIELDVVLDSPILVLPRNRSSSQVLIANLGQITVLGNADCSRMESEFEKVRSSTPDVTANDFDSGSIKYNIFICDISLFSSDLKDKWELVENLKMTYPTTNYTTLLRAQELYYCDPSVSTAILHNTVIHLSINYSEESNFPVNLPEIIDPSADEDIWPKIDIQGRVINSLKLSLTPQQYSLVLDSLDNVAAGEEDFISTEVNLNVTERRLNWEKELNTFSRKGHLTEALPLPSPTMSTSDAIPIFALFEVPEVIVELVLPESKSLVSESPHLVLSCVELIFDCEKKDYTTELKISLKSLILEDLSVPPESAQRVLAVSKTTQDLTTTTIDTSSSIVNSTSTYLTEYFRANTFVSTSCPDIPKTSPVNIIPRPRYQPQQPFASYSSPTVARTESSSLPDKLDPQDIFGGRFFPKGFSRKKLNKTGRTKIKSRVREQIKSPESNSCPETPPPSPRPFETGENLVQIQVTLVDAKSPQFISKYKATHKYTNVDFNTLEIFLSPNTFQHIRRFFNEASLFSNDNQSYPTPVANNKRRGSKTELNVKEPIEEARNSELKMTVKALRVKLGESQKVLAQGDVLGFLCHLANRGKEFVAVEGRLGSLEVQDKTPYAGLFPVKFVFQGDQALDFDYCRRDNDANFRLAMASVLCVHTQRFYTEFSGLLSALFDSTSTSSTVPSETYSSSSANAKSRERSTRVYLNVQAGAPVLLLPYSSTSKSILVADLGHLSVKNLEATNSYDCISVDLIEMDLYSSVLTEPTPELLRQYSKNQESSNSDSSSTSLKKIWKLNKKLIVANVFDNCSYLKNKCALNLKVIRSLTFPTSPTQPLTGIQGSLSTVYITLDSDKYKLIRGVLSYNIGENVVSSAPIKQRVVDVRQRKQSLGNETYHLTQTGANASSQLELSVELDLVNVSMELIKPDGEQLCRTFFLKSKLTFQSNSDRTKDVGLVSQEIVITDARTSVGDSCTQDQKNVFTNILQQSTSQPEAKPHKMKLQAGTSQGSSASSSGSGTLQAEIHLRQTVGGSNVTVILNNMRLMLVIDWWMEFHAFLSQHIPVPEEIPQATIESVIEYENIAGNSSNNSLLLLTGRQSHFMSPVVVSAGIVTKRAPVLDIPLTTYELKINISKCEIVVVEDPTIWDTNAIILKSTAVSYYRPHLEHPVYVNLLSCELFSCVLGLESETALSIVDPTKNVILEVVKRSSGEPLGLLDATMPPAFMKILKIQSPQLNLRLSYYDMKMFIQLVDRFSREAQTHLLKSETKNWEFDDEITAITSASRVQSSNDLDQLVSMGFDEEDSLEALERCDGKLEDAALLLSSGQFSDPSLNPSMGGSKKRKESYESGHTATSSIETTDNRSLPIEKNESNNNISGLELKCAGLSLCVIDDCKDADVPLVEFTISQLDLSQNFAGKLSRAEGILSGDYYNRQLSGWEPFLEPWKCSITWKQNEVGQLGKASPTREFPMKLPRQEISLISTQIMNINITSTLLNLYETVSFNWSEEYQKADKRRTPFVPFALKNETGSPLWFTTILSSNEEIFRQQKLGTSNLDGTNWIQVGNGKVQSFSFEGRGKLRGRSTHQLKTHQLVIRVDGWQDSNPVSVDKVGTYFRMVKPIPTTTSRYGLQNTELPPARLIFEVSLQGSAQKLVRIRSALLVKNELPDPMELKLENTIIYPGFQKAQTGGSLLIVMEPGQICPVPLHSICAQMWVRPHRTLVENSPSLYMYCSKPMVLGDNTNGDGLRTCCPVVVNQLESYRFCVAAKRDEFPIDSDDLNTSVQSATQLITLGMSRRPNFIALKSPLTISNLLPNEVFCEIKEYCLNFRVGPGKEYSITSVDISEYVEILFKFENFPNGTSIGVQPSSSGFSTRLKVLDIQKRSLYLNCKVDRGDGGSVRVSISCPYWVINKSGIPIICKQEGTSEAAGQFKEHEMGRMATPLLFSFTDYDKASALTLRAGNNLHAGSNTKSHWCRTFPLQGQSVRKLAVTISHSQPEIIYIVGIDVREGRGRYRDTKLVTITPRFLIDNRSSNAIQISQISFATSFLDPAAEATQLTLPPDCSLPFHWPRLDKDLLLCVKLLSLHGSAWSGGFPIENVDSFHINIRDLDGNCHFLRVEIVIQGPTYVVVFSDTDKLPAPFRIDNLSLVPITFHQASVGDDRKLAIRAESSCPYAWDEIMQPPNLTIVAPGGTSAIVNMNNLGLVGSLSYENFFYIALSATFPKETIPAQLGGSGMETMQLVLDVVGLKVVLARKEPGKRSQLWRVTGDGLIEHEGSSAPRDAKKPPSLSTMLVLDIGSQAAQPSNYITLALRKPDSRRASTQHWEFTKDGRLKCANYTNLYVQAKDGFGGEEHKPNEGAWRLWNEIVLGPPQSVVFVRTDSGIPVEQAISRQKLRAGSGRLELHIDTDGPTRVLRIIDIGRRPKGPVLNHIFEENFLNSIPNFLLNVNLHTGIGASIINCNPREELMYLRLFTLHAKWSDSKESETVEISVQNLQIDNQLFDAEKSICVFVIPTPTHYDNIELDQPALLLNWRRLKSRLNAHLFRNWMLALQPLSITIEEVLLLKFCSWIGFGKNSEALEGLKEPDFQIQQAVTNATSLTAKRFYFGVLRIALNQVRLSVLTASKLTPELHMVKRRLGLTLMRFEEALIELDPFVKEHPFETFEFLLASLVKHYKDELLSQALLVLGSVDFLGNPVGFVNDVSVGVSGLIHEGSVGSLIKNVTHGISNSAAKVTGSLGDGLGRTFTLDDKHELIRRRIIQDSNTSSDQFVAGLRGLGHGIVGGFTSIFTQPYEGFTNDGFTGLISGLGKGIVGTVTKPAVGVLDLASGTASAIRDSSKSSSRRAPKRLRPTRIVASGGILTPYSEHSSHGQELLFEINNRNYNECLIGYETFKSGAQELEILISTEHARVKKPGGKGQILDIQLKDLIECQHVVVNENEPSSPIVQKKHFVEFFQRLAEGHLGMIRPQVLVDNESIAKKIVQQVNYAKILCEEMKHSLISKPSSIDE